MSTAQITLNGKFAREIAIKWITQAPAGTRVLFKSAKRSGDQNSKLWACLTEIARQVPWHGQKLTADDWKLIFMDSLKRELRIVPNVDGTGFVNLGRSSSRLTKQDFSDLLELIAAFAANHNVTFRDDTARHTTPHHDTSRNNTARHLTTPHGTSPHFTTQHNRLINDAQS